MPSILAAEDCDGLLAAIERGGVQRSRAGFRHLMSVAEVRRLALDRRLLSIARQWVGAEPFPYRATLFDKSADANWLVVWHQDTALPLVGRFDEAGWGPWSVKEGVLYAHAPADALARIVAIRIHLDDSLAHNGPLRVLPGSQTGGVLSDTQIQTLAQEIAPVDCLVGRGGIVAMRPLLVHSSSKSKVASPRRVLHLEYADAARLRRGIELAVA